MRYLDQEKRAQQKVASRRADQARLASGEVSAAQLAEENSFIPRKMLKGACIVRRGRHRVANPLPLAS